jgi:hypothetical protein
MPQPQRPNHNIAGKPTVTRRRATPLEVTERAYSWCDATARCYQAQLEALPKDAKPTQRTRLERMATRYYLLAANVASKAAPFCNPKLTTHLIKPSSGASDGMLILYRRKNETDDDLLARARKETGLIIERAGQSLSTEGGQVLIMDEGDQLI